MKSTVIKRSAIHGLGLFACRPFTAGDCVELIDAEFVLRKSKSKFAIPLKDGRSLILRNKVKYVNHSPEANAKLDLRKGLVALRSIKAGEELTAAYATAL